MVPVVDLAACKKINWWAMQHRWYEHRPSYHYNVGTEHVGFSPTTQTLLAPKIYHVYRATYSCDLPFPALSYADANKNAARMCPDSKSGQLRASFLLSPICNRRNHRRPLLANIISNTERHLLSSPFYQRCCLLYTSPSPRDRG